MKMIKVTFATQGGEEKEFEVHEGMTVLDIARQHNINIEGICEGSLVCSTCHVVIEKGQYDELCATQPISDAEEDMLDLAINLTPTSRLGCQVKATDGLRVILPKHAQKLFVK